MAATKTSSETYLASRMSIAEKQRRLVSALRRRSKKTPRLILDVGCGPGHLASLARAAGQDVHAFDVSPGLLSLARDRVSPLALKEDCLRLRSLGYKIPSFVLAPKIWQGDAVLSENYHRGPYDLILCLGGVIEFTSDPESALSLMMESLKSRGRLLLEVENRSDPRYYWSLGKRWLAREISLIEAASLFRRRLGSKVFCEKRDFSLPSGGIAQIDVNTPSIAAIAKIANEAGCSIRIIQGLGRLAGTAERGRNPLWRLGWGLSFFAPFNRFSSHLWFEIEKKG